MKKSLMLGFDGKTIVSKKEIMRILFHRGRMLLLDQVTITNGRAIGEFTVPVEICEDHEPLPGMTVMRGVDIVEIAFQLFGALVAKSPELKNVLRGKIFVAREINCAKFSGFVRPGDKLFLETNTLLTIAEIAGTLRIESGLMVARVDGEKRCSITSVVITGSGRLSISKSHKVS